MMITLCDLLQVLSTGAIGLLVGALLAEGALLVPYWRSLPHDTFYTLHKEYGPRLYRFFAPLTIAPTFLIVVATGVSIWTSDSGQWPTLAASIFFLSVIATYIGYFRQANARLATASLNAEELSLELARWATWHWVRVVLGVCAFGTALFGVTIHA
ncbi:MAG: DUF1772 domain-containing protein [Acidobacteriota bacterium]